MDPEPSIWTQDAAFIIPVTITGAGTGMFYLTIYLDIDVL